MLLFTQAAFAARPCVQAGMSAASAMAADKDGESGETSMSRANVCVLKCTDGDKVPAQPPLAVLAAASEPVLTVAVPHADGPTWNSASRGNASHDPPKTIRFCSFLI